MKALSKIILTVIFLGFTIWIAHFLLFDEVVETFADLQQVEQTKDIHVVQVKSIEVDSPFDVYIAPHDNPEQASVRLGGEASEKYKDRYNLNIDTIGNTLRIKVQQKKIFSFGFNISKVNLTVYVPKSIYETIKLNTSSGNISADSLEAKHIHINSASGDIRIKHLKGETFKAQTSSGDISLADVNVKQVNIKTSSGDITADSIQAENSNISATSGDIKLRWLNSKAIVQSTSGDVTLKNKELVHDLTATSGSGAIILYVHNEPSAMTVKFTSSSGSGKLAGKQLLYSQKNEHDIRAAIGSGGPNVDIQTRSGDFALNID